MPSDSPNSQDANGDLASGGEGQDNGPRLQRSVFRALIQDFGPLWFTWTMNSGVIAILLHQCPYRFNGIDIIADIFFVFALVTYVVFSFLFIARFVWFKRAAYDEIAGNMSELTFAPCWTIAFMTLTSCVALIVSSASWGGYPFTLVAYVMWWFVQTWNALCLFWAFLVLIRKHEASNQRLPTSVIIPAVSVSTVGLTGAVISAYAKDISARLAVPIMILSFEWTGIGIITGLILTSYLFHAMLTKGWPAPDQTASVFILVGPMGQSAAALQILGSGALTYGRFGEYNSGTFITAEAAKGLSSACTLIALLLNGIGVIWMTFGIIAMIERASNRELHWTPTWNAIVFPNGTLATSMLSFSIDLDSPAYRVFTAIMIICLIIAFLVNLVFTVIRIYEGKLLIVREDWRVKQQVEQEKQE